MAQMTAEELIEKMSQISGNKTTFDPKNIDEFQKSIKNFTAGLKQQQPALKGFQDLLNGTSAPLVNAVREIDELNRAIKEEKNAKRDQRNVERLDQLETSKAELKKAVVSKNVTAAVSGLGMGVASLTQAFYEGARDFAKNLQSGASGIEAYTNATLKAVDASAQTAKAFGGVAQSVGLIVALMGPWGRAIGLVVTGLGMLGEWLGGKSAEKLKDGVTLFSDEIKKTQKGFNDITKAGAVFAGGMTEMREEAARAGLDIAMLATVVRNAKDDLTNMGLGLGEATRRVAGVSKELRNSQLGMQLRNLGYNAEEQAELAAQVMARQNAAGEKRILSDKELAQVTVQYGKDLKFLADITGQDAKKAMERAAEEALEVDVLAKAQREGGAEGFKKMQKMLATMPEVYKKGFMEMYSGGAITDVASRLGVNNNPALKKQFDRQMELMRDRNTTEEQAGFETATLTEKSLSYARENLGAYEVIGRAARLGKDAQLQEITNFRNKEILEERRRKEGSAIRSKAETERMALNQQPLDAAVQGIEENADRLRSALGKALLDPITRFAEVTAAGADTIENAIKKLIPEGESARRVPPTNTPVAGGTGGGAATGGAKIGRRIAVSSDADAQEGGFYGAGTILSKNLKIKGGIDGQATAGGSTTSKLAEVANQVHDMLKGDYMHFSGFNDASKRGSNSLHPEGRAFDLVLNNPAHYAAVAEMIRGIPGVSKVLDESQRPADPSQAKKWGPHIHAEVKAMAKGGITDGVSVAGEAGPEAVVPLPDGRTIPVRMDTGELVAKMEELIRIAKDQRDNSEKMLHAVR